MMVQYIEGNTVICTFTNISFSTFLLLSILFWLGKDCAWNGLIPSMWIIFVLPTLLIACDFVFSSLFSEVSTCVRASSRVLASTIKIFHYLWNLFVPHHYLCSYWVTYVSHKVFNFSFSWFSQSDKIVITRRAIAVLTFFTIPSFSYTHNSRTILFPISNYCRNYW